MQSRRVWRVLLLSLAALLWSASANAVPMSVVVPLTGEQEEPEPVFTGASGTALLTFDDATGDIDVDAQVFGIDVADLVDAGGFGAFHLHLETPDAPTDQVGPIAVSFGAVGDWQQHQNGIRLAAAGTSTGTFSSGEIETALLDGSTYLNLHTSSFPSGELRGDVPGLLPPDQVPEPATLGLLGLGVAGLLVQGTRRARRG